MLGYLRVLGEKMKNQKIVITKIGAPETMQVVDEEIKSPSGSDVLVKILTTGVAFADISIRYGQYPGVPKPPVTPGYDLIGIIEQTGPDVSSFVVGDKVAALTVFGAYSKYISLPASQLVKIPQQIDPIKSEALVLNYVTAYQMLHRVSKVKPKQRVLIHGASGGVGTALMQLGKLMEQDMVGTASQKNHALLKKYGVTPINYRTQDFEEILKNNPVDVVFESIGGKNIQKSLKVLKKGGLLVYYGARSSIQSGKYVNGLMGKSIVESIFYNILPNGKKTTFYAINAKKQIQQFREDLTSLIQLLNEGKIDPVIGATYPLEQAAAANQAMENGDHIGKIVLICN
ncbi:MAG: oxidoreductase [Anaerolineaceae bacterium]|nr:oxidoreductase [Anaerolineaceae bacterium]